MKLKRYKLDKDRKQQKQKIREEKRKKVLPTINLCNTALSVFDRKFPADFYLVTANQQHQRTEKKNEDVNKERRTNDKKGGKKTKYKKTRQREGHDDDGGDGLE